MFECDSLEDEKSEELSHLAKLIKVVSGINTEGWDSLKIATALKKIWCPEEADNSCEVNCMYYFANVLPAAAVHFLEICLFFFHKKMNEIT